MAVRELLTSSDDFARLDPSTRTTIAGALARIGSSALEIHEEAAPRRPLAFAQNAGSDFSGTAVDRVAGTTQNIMNAVSFPRFVNELITGVFKAMNDSNQQQLTAFVDLIRNVAQTTEGFADANVGVSGARQWLADHFPGSYQIDGGDEVDMASELEGLDPAEARERRAEIQAEQDANTRLIMRPGGQPPSEAALRSALGAPEGTPMSAGDPEALVPLARQVLARNRQQLLATMIQMGLQRIVVESGRVNAAMKLHVDASSAAENDKGSQFDMRNTTEGAIGAKFGPWGAEAKIQNTIGYVTTDRTSTTERINASVDLDSGVELVFRTDYVPLTRLAGVQEVERIRVNTLNPEAEAARLTAQANARATTDQARDAAREHRFDSVFHQPPDVPHSELNPRDVMPGGSGSETAGSAGAARTGTTGGRTGTASGTTRTASTGTATTGTVATGTTATGGGGSAGGAVGTGGATGTTGTATAGSGGGAAATTGSGGTAGAAGRSAGTGAAPGAAGTGTATGSGGAAAVSGGAGTAARSAGAGAATGAAGGTGTAGSGGSPGVAPGAAASTGAGGASGAAGGGTGSTGSNIGSEIGGAIAGDTGRQIGGAVGGLIGGAVGALT